MGKEIKPIMSDQPEGDAPVEQVAEVPQSEAPVDQEVAGE